MRGWQDRSAAPPEDYGNIAVEVYKQEVVKRVCVEEKKKKKKRGRRQEVTDWTTAEHSSVWFLFQRIETLLVFIGSLPRCDVIVAVRGPEWSRWDGLITIRWSDNKTGKSKQVRLTSFKKSSSVIFWKEWNMSGTPETAAEWVREQRPQPGVARCYWVSFVHTGEIVAGCRLCFDQQRRRRCGSVPLDLDRIQIRDTYNDEWRRRRNTRDSRRDAERDERPWL